MTFIEKFEEIKKVLSDADEKKFKKNFAIEVNMTDDDCGGIFYIANMDKGFEVEPYNYFDNTSRLVGNAADVMSALKVKANCTKLLKSERIRIEGFESDIAQIHMALKKDTVKKAAKSAVKKASDTIKGKAPAVKQEAKIIASVIKDEASKKAPAVKEGVKKAAAAVKESAVKNAPAVKEGVKKAASAVREEAETIAKAVSDKKNSK